MFLKVTYFSKTYLHSEYQSLAVTGATVALTSKLSTSSMLLLLMEGNLKTVTYSLWFLARGFLYTEDGGDTFPLNVGLHNIYTTPHPRRRHSSLKMIILL
jgi:hypothetical protein